MGRDLWNVLVCVYLNLCSLICRITGCTCLSTLRSFAIPVLSIMYID
jgi:hypothetical protein